jgi:hypothetical protein
MEDLRPQHLGKQSHLQSVDAVARSLRQAFFHWRETQGSPHVFALLDLNHPVPEDHSLHPKQLAKRTPVRTMTAIVRPDLSHEPALLPQLVSLHEPGDNGYPDDGLIDTLIECALARSGSVNGAYVTSLFCSTVQATELAAHMAKAGALFDLGQGQRRFLPLFEPYRFALVQSDPESQIFLRRWMGPIGLWFYFDCMGQPQFAGSGSDAKQPTDTSTKSSSLNKQQFESQQRVSDARFVILALQERRLILGSAPERRIDAALACAQLNGLQNLEDKVFFALNELTLGSHWSAHPEVQVKVKMTAVDPDLRLADALSSLSDEVLNNIAAPSSELPR